ncbi:MAG: SLC13 family permease [Candidatus Phaeomarinobacter sp.]
MAEPEQSSSKDMAPGVLSAAHTASRPHPRHRRLGLLGGVACFLILMAIGAPEGMPEPAWTTLAIASLMAIWWATEAVPLAATALVPLVAFPFFGVQAIRPTGAAYGHPLIFLFMGGFLVAQAMQRWNLHRRIALSIAVRAGASPTRLIAGFMAATAFLSMWVSNTATTIMMLPIAASVVSVVILNSPNAGHKDAQRFGLATMLAISYSASVGGIATLVGTPPNALFAAFFSQEFGFEVSFAGWMVLAMPLVIIMLPTVLIVLTRIVCRFDLGTTVEDAAHGQEEVRKQLKDLGPVSTPEARVAIVFTSMAVLWLFRPLLDDLPLLSGVTDPGIAIAGALALFLIPAGGKSDGSGAEGKSSDEKEGDGGRLLDWAHAKNISWDVLILFGGGLALAGAFSSTGLAAALGEGLGALSWLPVLVFVLAIAAMVIFLTELTSNTATVAALLPVVAAIAEATGHSPIVLAVAAVMAASCAFMLPVATPPNAIVFASGYVTVPQMMRAGFALNIIGILLIALLATYVAPLVLSTSLN